MAPTEKIAPLPDTLPEDFGEWDGDASSAPAPVNSNEWEPTPDHGETGKNHGQSGYLEEILASFDTKSRVWRSDSQSSSRVKQEGQLEVWPKESLRAPSPVKGDDWESAATVVEPAKRVSQPAQPKTVLSPALDAPLNTWPDLSQPVFAKPQKAMSEVAPEISTQASNKPEGNRGTKGAPVARGESNSPSPDGEADSPDSKKEMIREADSVLFQGFSSKKYDAEEDENSSKKKRVILVAAGACSLLLPLILMISFGHHGTKAAVKQTVQPVPAATDTQAVTTPPDQQVIESSPQDKPQAATPKQQTPDSEAVLKEDAANSTQPASELQTQMMNDQLTAPRMISGDMKKQGVENAPPPPSLGAGAADGLGGGSTMASVFGGHNQPIVKSARPITISSGVATGMLIQKTPPIYPTIAKAARVSGTVELQATISKAGTIKDLHIVSGPAMLRQPALDAVRTWRYKPYKLNNDPVEVETTVNVVFTLGN